MLPARVSRVSAVAFACSGFAGLVYQVVWLRLAFTSFGVITPVLSIVVSVFMAGLGVGAVLGGRFAARRAPRAALIAYACAELGVGALAPTVKAQLALGQAALSSVAGASSTPYLVLSGLALALALIVPCTLMGTTYPLMLAAVRGALGDPSSSSPSEPKSFGRLYLANTIGAAVGALGSVFIIEIVGFSSTILIGALANATAALCALSLRDRVSRDAAPAAPTTATPTTTSSSTSPERLPAAALFVLFTTGFASMAMEVVWSRMFAHVLGHLVYSFASLLCAFLLATTVGATLYRRGVLRMSIDVHVALVAIAAVLPIFLNDVRVAPATGDPLPRVYALLTIVPLCVLLGALTPRIIDEHARGDPRLVGRAYAVNVIGCVIGPLVASYALLPNMSCAVALAVLAAPLAIWNGRALLRGVAAAAVVGAGAFAWFVVITYDDPVPRDVADEVRVIRRDHTTTVTSSGTGLDKRLMVNGLGVTLLTPITKDMAHLPLLAVKAKRAPESALVICLGMGTTWRSLMSWDIHAVAVELSPSVVDAMPYYYDDAEKLRADPRGAVIVDDGRRFLARTDEMFDVITLDPPPPLDAAGVGLLFTDEFYALAKKRLKRGGVMQAWVFAPFDSVEMEAITRSFVDAFPYARAYAGIEGFGVHLLGSDEPIELPADLAAALPPAARADLDELSATGDGLGDMKKLTAHEIPLGMLVGGPAVRMTDDMPLNEYHWLRDAFFPRR